MAAAIDAMRRPFSERCALSVKPAQVLVLFSRTMAWCSGQDSNLHALGKGF